MRPALRLLMVSRYLESAARAAGDPRTRTERRSNGPRFGDATRHPAGEAGSVPDEHLTINGTQPEAGQA